MDLTDVPLSGEAIGWVVAPKEIWSEVGCPSIDYCQVISSGSVLGLALFDISDGDMDSRIQCTLSKFANVTKLCGAIDLEEMPSRGILRDLESWIHVNLKTFHKSKCKVLHLGQGNPRCKVDVNFPIPKGDL